MREITETTAGFLRLGKPACLTYASLDTTVVLLNGMNEDIDIIATHGGVDQGLVSLRHREWIALCEQGKD